jgi:pimeloyl-ACP methyl ester carboxylesterase
MKMLLLILSALIALSPSQLIARPMVVAFGGFGSCAVAGYTSEMKASVMIDHLARNLDADLIKTCFALSTSTVFAENIESGEGFRGSISDLFDFIAESADGPILLVGQSYGGWLALQASLHLPSEIRILGLATIDPISMETCSPANFAGSILIGSDPGCTEAPSDLASKFERIKRRVGDWHHFYQTEFSNLHSSRIPIATTNQKLSYGESWHPFGAHALTETDPRIWNNIQSRFINTRN